MKQVCLDSIMPEWLSLAELVGLPSLPTSVRALRDLAKRENWRSRKRQGRGGGSEFFIEDIRNSLPGSSWAALLLRFAPKVESAPISTTASPDLEAQWEAFRRLSGRKQEAARRKARALREVRDLTRRQENRLTSEQACDVVAEQYGVDRRTIMRWRSAVQGLAIENWPLGLVPQHKGGQATSEIPEKAFKLFCALYLTPEKPDAEHCYRQVIGSAKERGWGKMPSQDTFMRRLKRRFTREEIILQRQGETVLKAAIIPPQERDHATFHALEAVVADGHQVDVFVMGEDGKVFRPVLVGWQDVYSGKILSWRIDRTENVDAVRLSFCDLLAYGIPSYVFLDNGRAFASKQMTGGIRTRFRFTIKDDDPLGLLPELGIDVHWCTPYSGQSKPIERTFKDLASTLSKDFRFKGAYVGNNPTNKPENYGSRAIPLRDFLAVAEQAINEHNAREGRKSRVCAGRSLDQAFQDSYEKAEIRKATAAQRQLFLLAAEGVTANKRDGSITFFKNRFYNDKLSQYAGQKLVVRFDPYRLQAPVQVFTLNNEFICEAECVNPVGFLDTDAAREHNRERRKRIKDVKQSVKEKLTLSDQEVCELLPAVDRAPMPETKVVRPEFGKPQPAIQVQEEQASKHDEKFAMLMRMQASQLGLERLPNVESL